MRSAARRIDFSSMIVPSAGQSASDAIKPKVERDEGRMRGSNRVAKDANEVSSSFVRGSGHGVVKPRDTLGWLCRRE